VTRGPDGVIRRTTPTHRDSWGPANAKIRLLTGLAFGFGSPEAFITLAILSGGGYRPSLPDRTIRG
jgi:hypothetical protein